VFDLPDTGERVVTNPVLSGGVITMITNIPNGADPCNPGGSSWMYSVDYATGGRIAGVTNAGSKMGNFLSSRVVLIRLPSGRIVGLVRTSTATTVTVNPPPKTFTRTGRRLSWRELPDTNDVP
jgi:type IV pilus assembly protein PilY1